MNTLSKLLAILAYVVWFFSLCSNSIRLSTQHGFAAGTHPGISIILMGWMAAPGLWFLAFYENLHFSFLWKALKIKSQQGISFLGWGFYILPWINFLWLLASTHDGPIEILEGFYLWQGAWILSSASLFFRSYNA